MNIQANFRDQAEEKLPKCQEGNFWMVYANLLCAPQFPRFCDLGLQLQATLSGITKCHGWDPGESSGRKGKGQRGGGEGRQGSSTCSSAQGSVITGKVSKD